MKIHGLQKMTLLDFPGHVACTVFLGGCDLRCPYCHNYELATGQAPPIMEEEELFAFLRKRKGLLDGVAITGGEPCLHPDLPAFIGRIKEMGYPVKLDTNGTHPATLQQVLEGGLVDYVAMDIKNSPSKYAMTVGLERIDPEPIRRSIDLLMQDTTEYEFRTTVVRELHEAQDFEEIGQMIAGASRYYLQKFTDRDTVPYGNLHAHSKESMQMFAEIVSKYVDYVSLRGVD
jgi:pyruvate formate lyase activating enzyme